MDYIEYFQRSIDYIEKNLKSEVTVEEIAKHVGFSTYHFYRLFREYIGIPVMEYVRQRRLAYAASELISERRIIDIALDYGFDTHNGFSKAFRKVYGCSPEHYRENGTGYVPEKIDLRKLRSLDIQGGIVAEPRIIKKPPFYIAGYALHTTLEENKDLRDIRAFWDYFEIEGIEQRLYDTVSHSQHGEYCVWFPPDMETGEYTYVLGVKADTLNNIPLDMFKGEISEAVYAVFTTPRARHGNDEFVKSIKGTWRYIFDVWFPNSGYEFAENKVEFELYDERCHDANDALMEIYIPVVKRNFK